MASSLPGIASTAPGPTVNAQTANAQTGNGPGVNGESPAAQSLNAQPFRSSVEHLLTELEYLKLLLHRQILRLRAATLLREDQFRGLYISDEEVDALLLQGPRSSAPASAHSPSVATVGKLTELIEAAANEMALRLQATHAAGVSLSLFRLAHAFELSPFEQFALLLCAAPEIDARFETLYAYVQNDVSRKRPTPNLILKLFGSSVEECLAMRVMFSSAGKLLNVPLISFSADSPDREHTLLSRPLRADPRIVGYLLEQGDLDDRLRSFAEIDIPARSFSHLHLREQLKKELQDIARVFADQGFVIFLQGRKGSGKRSVAGAISLEQRRPLLVARLNQLLPDQISLPQAVQLLQREAVLQGANIYLDAPDLLFSSDAASHQKMMAFVEALDPKGFLILVGSTAPVSLADSSARCSSLSFALTVPEFAERRLLWNDALAAMNRDISLDVIVTDLANKFVLTGGEIESVAREAASRALLRNAGGAISMADIEAAARGQSNQGLRRLAQKVNCIHDWRDLVLPARSIRQLREVCTSEKFRHVVYSQWGYDRRLAAGKGLNALFCGPSGTGKTMAAGIIARALSLDLYKIDLSSVVSKYIGETEKQLNQIFHEAGSSNAILFFDEADALFGKRSEVKDAHDRYANVEVAYLLQKMEEYEGIVILATNFRRNMDEAFTRRMHHIVEFPFPDANLRGQIWKGLVPPGAPLAADVNFGFLGRQFELSGGNIRNVALAAAFLAAEAGGDISMEHFVRATAREMQKLGRLPSRSEFREYYDLLRISA